MNRDREIARFREISSLAEISLTDSEVVIRTNSTIHQWSLCFDLDAPNYIAIILNSDID